MTPRDCPTLITPRLTLAPHGALDFEDCRALWADPVVVRYLGGLPASGAEVWARLLRYAGLWKLMGYGYWSLRETATGRYAGEAGLAEFRRDVTPSLIGTPEAGWALASWAHGQGFAREALEAIYAWADQVLPDRRTVCMIDPANLASLRLAARLGFTPFADTVYQGKITRLLERPIPIPDTSGLSS